MTARLSIDIEAVVRGLSELQSMGGALEDAGEKASRFDSVATGAFERVGHKIIDIGTNLIGMGLSAVIEGIGNSIELASNKAEAASKVNVLYGESAAQIVAASENAATSVGLSSGAYLAAAGDLGNLLTNMDITGDAAAGMSVDMIQLAADVGSFNNADPSEVIAAMGAGFRGEAEPLRRFGVMLSEGAIQAKALELGLIAQGEALTPAARAQATYAVILEDTAAAQGDFARTSEGLANQQRIAAARQEEAWTRIGEKIAPIANFLVPLLADVLSGAIDLILQIADAVGRWVAENQPLIQSIVRILQVIGDVVGGGLRILFDWIGRVIDIGGRFLAAFLDIGRRIFTPIQSAIQTLGDVFGRVWSGIQSGAQRVMDFLGNMFRPLVDGFNRAIGVVRDAWNAFARIWNGIQLDIPRVEIPNPLGGSIVLGGGSFGLPDLPTFARGGIATRPTFGIFGESGPEALVPLSRAGGIGRGVTVNVYTGVGDPVEIGREVVDAIRAFERANGPAF